ncbi:MAG: hypothetical protein HOP96_00900 [Sphingomonas sp.]|nr:hypothetical protein [Sphingomonas sp.]
MRILHFIGAILVFVAAPAFAKGPAAWTVMQRSGDVQVLKNGLQPASVKVQDALSPGDVVATGANGRAMLTRGEDYVVVAPSSRLALPKEQQQSGFTRLIQQVGTMLYKVKHTGVPHFAVETPMLAAVVKGTSFTVVVDKDRAAVQVTDGIVEVNSAAGGARRLVERGVTVYVGRERPNQIIEMKPGAADLPSSAGSDSGAVKIKGRGDVPLSTITDLTGGLIREVPATPVVAVNSNPVVAVATVQPVASTADVSSSPAGAVADTSTPVVASVDVSTQVVSTPAAGTPAASTPSVTTVAVTTPAVTTPAVTTAPVTTPVATVSPVTVTPVTVPTVAVTSPTVTPTTIATPTVSVQAVTTPTVTTPTVTTPAVTVTPVTVTPVTVSPVTVPTVTPVSIPGSNSGPGSLNSGPGSLSSGSGGGNSGPGSLSSGSGSGPVISTPTVTTPTVTTPTVTTPTIVTPVVTVPTVTVPTVTVPPVTVPTIGIGLPKGP